MDERFNQKRNTPDGGKEKPKKRILVADDDDTILAFAVGYLTLLGYEVFTVSNGQKLLDELASGENFDAVLTDIQMPVMDGVTAFELIRKNPQFQNLPVVVHSGTWNLELEKKVDELRGKRLEKPYGEKDLKHVFDEIFEEHAA